MDKREKLIADFIEQVKTDYTEKCRRDFETPNLVGLILFLESKRLLHHTSILRYVMEAQMNARAIAAHIVKKAVKLYGVKVRTAWHILRGK